MVLRVSVSIIRPSTSGGTRAVRMAPQTESRMPEARNRCCARVERMIWRTAVVSLCFFACRMMLHLLSLLIFYGWFFVSSYNRAPFIQPDNLFQL